MWQYSSTGKVAGIEGNVDLNLCFYDYSQPDAPAISLPAPKYTEAVTESGDASEDGTASEDAEEEGET